MTQDEWLLCKCPLPMLEFLADRLSDRKLRLFSCACCRRIWGFLDDERMRRALVTAERYANGEVALKMLERAHRNLDPVYSVAESESAYAAVWCASRPGRSLMAWSHASMVGEYSEEDAEREVQCRILRCIVGNPFRLVPAVDPSWLAWQDGVVPKLAQAIYDERRFEDLPILADALDEAGCDNADVIEHCRERAEHTGGCWVVDLLLGKE